MRLLPSRPGTVFEQCPGPFNLELKKNLSTMVSKISNHCIMKFQHDSLLKLMAYSLVSAVVGLISGFVLGYLIYGMSLIFYPSEISEGIYYFAPFLGMGFGTVIGAVLGGIVAIKKGSK